MCLQCLQYDYQCMVIDIIVQLVSFVYILIYMGSIIFKRVKSFIIIHHHHQDFFSITLQREIDCGPQKKHFETQTCYHLEICHQELHNGNVLIQEYNYNLVEYLSNFKTFPSNCIYFWYNMLHTHANQQNHRFQDSLGTFDPFQALCSR